jgi:hypothetical protein
LPHLALFNSIPSFSQRQKVSQQSQGLLAPHERRLLCQAFAQFGVECSLCSIWFWQMVDRKNSPNGLIATVFVNWYWIFFNGFKPLLYLAINRYANRVFIFGKKDKMAFMHLLNPSRYIIDIKHLRGLNLSFQTKIKMRE